MPSVTVRSPGECFQAEIDRFCALVAEGEEVGVRGLEQRVKAAEALVFLESDKELVGVAAIKNPNSTFWQRVFADAQSQHPPEAFPVELGWLFVTENHRGKGLSRLLVKKALGKARNRGVFATSRGG